MGTHLNHVHMKTGFKNKVVLVTGASRGIGKAVAEAFASAGAQVVIHYFSNEAKADEVLRTLAGEGHLTARANLADPNDIEAMVMKVIKEKGRIDILVNNAGIFEESDWQAMGYEEWQEYWKRTMDTNLTGVANLSFLVSKQMVSAGGGRIVNVSSRGAFRGEPDALPYGASKAGMNSLGQSMAVKLASKNVFVFTLAPGFVLTDMTGEILDSERGPGVKAQSPMNRVASPGELANAVLLLSSEGMEYASGCILDMNGASYLRS